MDTQTIFLSLEKLNERWKRLIENYHQCQVDFGLISKSNFEVISGLIKCENIISLTISDGDKTRGQMEYFFQLFNLDQFTRLSSLNLLQINRQDIINIFQSKTMEILNSLTLQFPINFNYQSTVLIELAVFLKKSNLQKLHLWFCPSQSIDWSEQCKLKYLKIHSCSLEEY